MWRKEPPPTLNYTGAVLRVVNIHTKDGRVDLLSRNENVGWRDVASDRTLIQTRSRYSSVLPIGYKSEAEVTAEEVFIQRNAENSGEYVGRRIKQTIPPGNSLSCYKNLFEGYTLSDTHGNIWSFARNRYFTHEFRWCDAVINGHLARNGDFTSVIRLVNGKIYGESAKGNGWWLWDGSSFSVNIGRAP